MCMLLHGYTVFVILFANWIPFYNSRSVFDHITLSVYALQCYMCLSWTFNPLNAELNPIRHLLALAGARHFVHVSRVRINHNLYSRRIAVSI